MIRAVRGMGGQQAWQGEPVYLARKEGKLPAVWASELSGGSSAKESRQVTCMPTKMLAGEESRAPAS